MTCVYDGRCGYRSSTVIPRPAHTLVVGIRTPVPPSLPNASQTLRGRIAASSFGLLAMTEENRQPLRLSYFLCHSETSPQTGRGRRDPRLRSLVPRTPSSPNASPTLRERIAASGFALLAMTCVWGGCCGCRSSSVIPRPVRRLVVGVGIRAFVSPSPVLRPHQTQA